MTHRHPAPHDDAGRLPAVAPASAPLTPEPLAAAAGPGWSRRRLLRTGLAGGLGLAGTAMLSGCGVAKLASGQAQAVPARDPADRTIRMIVTESPPYQEPTTLAKGLLASRGWTLEPTYVTDIVQPNQAVADGSYDVNFFQHVAYLKQFNADYGLDVVPLFYVYGMPGGVFSDRYASFDDVPAGALVGLPVDPANNGRALVMLAQAGLLELEDASVVHISQSSIRANPRGLRFVEVDQQALKNVYRDVDLAFLSVRMAADLKLTRDQALIFEDAETERPFRILVGGRRELLGTPLVAELKAAYQSPEVAEWFRNYQGGVLPTPWDADPAADYASL